MIENIGTKFDEWMRKKKKLHLANRIPDTKEGEIWWAAVGENVGVEINGKHGRFSRPVLIFKKFNRLSFMGIPLTSKMHQDKWHISFSFQGSESYAVLSQARAFSAARLYGKKCIGELSETDFQAICDGFERLYRHPKTSGLKTGGCG